jgi:hypothetical protein
MAFSAKAKDRWSRGGRNFLLKTTIYGIDETHRLI